MQNFVIFLIVGGIFGVVNAAASTELVRGLIGFYDNGEEYKVMSYIKPVQFILCISMTLALQLATYVCFFKVVAYESPPPKVLVILNTDGVINNADNLEYFKELLTKTNSKIVIDSGHSLEKDMDIAPKVMATIHKSNTCLSFEKHVKLWLKTVGRQEFDRAVYITSSKETLPYITLQVDKDKGFVKESIDKVLTILQHNSPIKDISFKGEISCEPEEVEADLVEGQSVVIMRFPGEAVN